ncbi:hypothetical protein BGZ46_001862 [Entomortierella lignicola]|nr:hypothetical protein BGZ46_001862 [Entomortierella lignicola]
MVENPSYRRRSNIRIGLDPIDIDDILPSYDSKGSLTRRISAGYQNAPFRSGRLENPYAADSLMSEQDMALDLESDYNKKVNPSASTWQTVPISKAPAYRPPPPDFTKKSSIQKSNSNHTIYIPPPLPPATVTSPRVAGGPSPYADEAMIIHPLKSSPSPSLSMAKSVSSGLGRSHAVAQMPMTHATATARKDKNEQKESNNTDMEDDELSELYLDSTLAVGGYTNTTSISAKDRASVSSFFSTLVVDPEPAPPLPPFTPLLPSFASEEFIIPAPVARIVPVTSTTTTRTTASPRPSPKIQQSDYDKQQEEIQVAACFAQDLGFEIVSPMTSPRSKAAIPFGQRRI